MRFTYKPIRKRTKILLFLILASVASLSTLLATATPAARRGPFLIGAQIQPQVLSTLERACQNCHSENTSWPWYSNLPVVSARIHGDVEKARRSMDFSKWDEYSDQQKRGFLAALVESARRREMPPRGYRLMHPEARLSEADLKAIQDWARAEQGRIREASGRLAH
jgi:hypothetical protein